MNRFRMIRKLGTCCSVLVTCFLCFSLTMNLAAESAGKRRASKRDRTPPSTWQLVFEDEFAGPTLDEKRWATEFPWGRERSNVGELQYYAPDAFSLANSRLQISARPTPNASHQYSSGIISSHRSFAAEFGRFEIRCKLPQGRGLWPAFWLLPADTSWPPEIDVFEALGHEPQTVYMVTHWSVGGEHRTSGASYTGPDFSSGFHTFAVEWSADTLIWYVDDVERHRVVDRSPTGPMYLLANLAVGGTWPGAPDASTPFPATFEIDYIRAYAPSTANSGVSKAKQQDKGNDKKNKGKNKKNKAKSRQEAGRGDKQRR